MTIIYVPSGEGHTFSPLDFGQIIEESNKYNPNEQNQYKRYIICNMTPEEEKLVKNRLMRDLMEQQGATRNEMQRYIENKTDYFYLKDIGHIKLR